MSQIVNPAAATRAAVAIDGRAALVNWPVDGDAMQAQLSKHIERSAGNVWSAPGVNVTIGIINKPTYTHEIAVAFYQALGNKGATTRGSFVGYKHRSA